MAEKTKASGVTPPDGDDDEKIIAEAIARFKLAEEAESENRQNAIDDLKFLDGDQWPEGVKSERSADGRPCLVINKLPQSVQQVTNDQRQNRPAIKVSPFDDKADVETAKVIQGIIRNIENDSSAETAYDTAFESAVKGGFGYMRVATGYAGPKSFDQKITIKRVSNPMSVFLDPHSREFDGSDANWGFEIEDMSRSEFKRRWPKAKLSGSGEWETYGASSPDWVKADSVRIADYFYKEFKDVELVLLSTGEVIEKSQLPEILPEGVSVKDERTAQIPTIKFCKLNGVERLEETIFPGSFIPLIPVYGAVDDIDGKRILKGIVRNAKDPARMYNYWKSAETEAIALAPRAPFIAAEGQLEGFEEQWNTANRKNWSVLKYKPISIGGTPVPPPQRNSFEPAIGAISNAAAGASDDIKTTTGIYDASLGGRSNETSGVAIQRRNNQAQTSNFHFVDNLTRSMRHLGRILVEIVPTIYDTDQAARIMGDDGQQRMVRINAPFVENGKEVLYALDAGRYDVTIDVGPSYATKRQEAADSMLELSKAMPQLMQVAGDLMVKQMDWPGAQELAERIKKTLPPGLADDDKNKPQELPPQVQQQMQQMNGMIEQLTAKLTEANQKIETKSVELESRERIEMAKLETHATIELAKLQSREALDMLANQIAEIDARQKMIGFGQPMEREQAPEAPQEFAPQDDGAQGAEFVEGDAMSPTGGESPGPTEQF